MPSELTVILKGSDSTYKQKFLIYEPYTLSPQDQTILQCIEEAKANFKLKPEETLIRISAQF